jgi:hypothetical protein
VPASWLIRIPEVFAGFEPDILLALGARRLKKLGRDFQLVGLGDPGVLHGSAAAKYVRWNLPVHHSWPCSPRDVPGFIEKAAQALARKFGDSEVQTLIAGPIDPGGENRYFRSLASNLRGRALQVFPHQVSAVRDAEEQDSRLPTLFCLVGSEGLFCGLQSPLDSNGFHPGGTRFMRQKGPETISRAGAKIAEAIHHLRLHREPPPPGSHWLELGASPGGMTAELLARGYRVTAVDRAPLDPRLEKSRDLHAVLADAAAFQAARGVVYDAILSDMNGIAGDSFAQIIRLSKNLAPGGIVIFTVKMPGVTHMAGADELENDILASAGAAGLRVLFRTHLTYNRHEFTFGFQRESTHPAS